ncbi:DUF4352 domain-containing protein [Planomonospora venezuelensis]|uniref:DUF4352 domain-containing protein n=1 Tax=Planomonospora venezuelensis TaxID=1999 RepID=A0A841D8T6_PLAVE|nr:DUF4352 domain-containing protein [Planomonospora venezuelensis]MBB5964738.1 hypothetical protein [Planomonospora venezuelensis]GIM99225.1 hypothetical protein Pve01_08840 [Planomonospora venezuelensis]
MPRRTALAAAAVLTVLATGCSPEPERPPRAAPSPTYELPARAVRPGEIPVTSAPVQDGEIRFQVIGLQKGLSGFFGSHAEWQAKGQYVVVRILMENPNRANSRFDAGKQRLVTAGGTAHAIDPFTQAIKRQPERFLLGAGVRVEMDLWFDVPEDAEPTAVRLFGDPPLGLARTDGVTVPLP